MSKKTKLIVLELVAGLFGWAWMIAGAFSIYYLVMAIGFDGGWSSFIVALVISGVAKWLAQGFEDSKKRVGFEAEMVAKGMSPKEAGEAWLKAYNGQEAPEPPVAATPAGAMKEDVEAIDYLVAQFNERSAMVDDFAAYIEQNPPGGEIFDVKCLPHDKQIILDAICLEIVVQDDEKRSGALAVCALTLADFQEGVGDTPLSHLGVDLTSFDFDTSSKSQEDTRALALQLANQIGGAETERKLYEKFHPLVEEDQANILAKIKASELMHQQMPDQIEGNKGKFLAKLAASELMYQPMPDQKKRDILG